MARRSRAPIASARSRATAGRLTSGPSRSDGRPRHPRRQPGAVHRDWLRRCVRTDVCRTPVSPARVRRRPMPRCQRCDGYGRRLPDRLPAAVLRWHAGWGCRPDRQRQAPGSGAPARTRPDPRRLAAPPSLASQRSDAPVGRRPCPTQPQSLPRAGCERRLGRWPHASARGGHDHWPRDPRPPTARHGAPDRGWPQSWQLPRRADSPNHRDQPPGGSRRPRSCWRHAPPRVPPDHAGRPAGRWRGDNAARRSASRAARACGAVARRGLAGTASAAPPGQPRSFRRPHGKCQPGRQGTS
jgi:hypothetical protein